jgi:hypothetical protein
MSHGRELSSLSLLPISKEDTPRKTKKNIATKKPLKNLENHH